MARTFRDEFEQLDRLLLHCIHQDDQIWAYIETLEKEIREVAAEGTSPNTKLIKALAFITLGGLTDRRLKTHKALMEGAKDNYLEHGGSLDDPLALDPEEQP